MVNLCACTFSLVVMPVIVFANYPNYQIDSKSIPLFYGFYDALGRITWSIAVCYIIFACIHNNGGPINKFLSLPMWQPLSRLSYSIYLIHTLILSLTIDSLKMPMFFSEITAFQSFIGVFVLSAFVAIPLTLAFELPIDAIYKLTAKRHNM